MGCCGSVDKDTAERLENLEKEIKALGQKTDDESLEAAAREAKELREIFEAFATSANMRGIERVQDLSDLIVRNLVGRIDPELLKKGPAEYQPLVDRLQLIGLDLDAVRATRATKLLESQVQKHLEQIAQVQEKAVDPILKKIQAMREKLQQPGQEKNLVVGTKDILENAEQAWKAAEGKVVAKALLEQLVPHALHILNSEEVWGSSATQCQEVVLLGGRVDELARQLVSALGATWDPPILPQVQRAAEARAIDAEARLVKGALQHLEGQEGGEAYHCLVELQPWWPWLKSSHSLEVVGVFSKMQSYAQEAFMQAARSGDRTAAEEIRGFAVQFDQLRGQFEGLPVASGRALGEVLEVGEAKIQVSRALGVVDAEVAKTTDDDESTNLSLATTIEALETLKVAWPVAKDEELSQRLQKTCEALEKFTFEAVQSCSVDQLGSLIQFAQEYDVRRGTMGEHEALRPRLATKAALKHLSRAEGELAKTEGMKPHVLLDSLQAVANLHPEDSDVRTHLLRVLAATDERLLRSYQETIAGEVENEKKELLLEKFAASADEVRSLLDGGESLVAKMQSQRAETASELIEGVEAQISEGQLATLHLELQALGRICKKLPSSAVAGKAQALAERFVAAARAAPNEALLAAPLGEALRGLGVEAAELRGDMLRKVCKEQLAKAQAMDLLELSEVLEKLEKLRKDDALPPELSNDIVNFCDHLQEPCMLKMLEVGRSRGAALLDLAVVADRLRAQAMLPRLTQAQKAVGLFEEANAELGKVSGMNPKLVVNVLKDLGPHLATVEGVAGYGERLKEILQKFEEKLEEASRKALASEGDAEAKLAGVLKLAEAADAAQVAWPSELRYRLAGLSVQQLLLGIEAELRKETGMNPKVLLQKFQELGKVWGEEKEGLRDRYQAACDKVGQRMKDSMQEAKASSNAGKEKALLQFAKEFDVASGGTSLEAELAALAGGDAM